MRIVTPSDIRSVKRMLAEILARLSRKDVKGWQVSTRQGYRRKPSGELVRDGRFTAVIDINGGVDEVDGPGLSRRAPRPAAIPR